MKLSQSPLAIIGILGAVIWLGCVNDDDNGVNNFTVEGVLLPSTKIAFVSSSGTSDDICVINADDKNVVNITNSDAIDSEPDWSPDGQKIAFASEREGALDIYVMNADGTNEVNITNNPEHYDSSPAWGLIR